MTDPMSSSWAVPEGGAPAGAPDPDLAHPPVPDPAHALALAPASAVKSKRKSGNVWNIVLGVAAIVAVAGIAFAGGRATAPAAATTGFARTGQAAAGAPGYAPTGSFDPGTAAGGAGGVGDRTMTLTGTVASIDGTTMTLTTQGGQTMTVDLSGAAYHAQAAATAADVTAGTSVQVSVTGFGGGMRPGASAAPDASGAPATATITATDVTIVAK